MSNLRSHHSDFRLFHDIGCWVSVQRSQNKRLKNAKTSTMTERRRKALERLGFSWTLRKRHSWDERFTQLKAFSDANGRSCDVLNEGKNKGLWTWCQNQRDVYRKSIEGRGTVVITKDKFEMLEKIGFNWMLSFPENFSSTGSTSTSSSQVRHISISSTGSASTSPLTDAMDASVPSFELKLRGYAKETFLYATRYALSIVDTSLSYHAFV